MQKIDHNVGFSEKRQFFRRKLSKIAENCQKSPKIVIITTTPEVGVIEVVQWQLVRQQVVRQQLVRQQLVRQQLVQYHKSDNLSADKSSANISSALQLIQYQLVRPTSRPVL
jgi:hypothetical protein